MPDAKVYVIRYQYKSLPVEDLDEYEDRAEAERMLAEYRLATRSDPHAKWWMVTRRKED